MGAKDTKTKEFLSDNERFADLFNYYLFDGKSVINAEDLEERDSEEVLSIYGLDKKELQKQRWRDLIKSAIIKESQEAYYILLGVENQSEIHYAMPVKDMIYAALNYGSQVNAASRRHRKEKDAENTAEFLSGFKKEDRLIPVITLTVFWGAGNWDGPLSLHDMFASVSPELLKYIPDFRIHLLVPNDITDFKKFRTSLGPVLEVVKASQRKQDMDAVIHGNPIFQNLENDAVSTINVLTAIQLKVDERKGVTDMCRAWEEQKMAGKLEGLKSYIMDCLESNMDRETIITKTMKIFQVTREEAETYFEECAALTV